MSLLFGKKGRRAVALGAAGLGTCAVLAACSPVQIGSAAIVGDQRITVSTVDTQVANLQAAVKKAGSSIPSTAAGAVPAQQPATVLSWLVRFEVMDRVATENGISVSQAQSQAALGSMKQLAAQDGAPSATVLLVANGIPPELFPQFGRWFAENTAYSEKVNGGKQPTSQAEQDKINKAQCQAAAPLNIQVSPQYGRIDYASAAFSVVPAADTLSRPAGVPSPASTEGLTPAAC